MTEFLTAAVGLILAMLGLGLVSILRGPTDADRMMAAQLIGTAGIAVLLLLGTVTGVPAAVDVALILALLATFASIAFVKGALPARNRWGRSGGGQMSVARDIITVAGVSAGVFFFSPAPSAFFAFPTPSFVCTRSARPITSAWVSSCSGCSPKQEACATG